MAELMAASMVEMKVVTMAVRWVVWMAEKKVVLKDET